MKAKTMSMSAKCSDMFSAVFKDADGNHVADHDGYVPDFMPGEHWGDYVMLDIDLASGKIMNWTPPTDNDIEELIAA